MPCIKENGGTRQPVKLTFVNIFLGARGQATFTTAVFFFQGTHLSIGWNYGVEAYTASYKTVVLILPSEWDGFFIFEALKMLPEATDLQI